MYHSKILIPTFIFIIKYLEIAQLFVLEVRTRLDQGTATELSYGPKKDTLYCVA